MFLYIVHSSATMNFNQMVTLVFYIYNSFRAYLNIDIDQNNFTTGNLGKLAEIRFYVFTRENPLHGKEINENLSDIRPEGKVKFIIHGWLGNSSTFWCNNLANVLLGKDNYTIIQVDWSKLAFFTYSRSAQNTKIVGEKLGIFINKIHQEQNISLHNIHIIGHSFGAHIAGFAGQKVIEMTDSKIRQITGLDASRLQFEVPQKPRDQRLSSDDAEIVEVLHTDAGVFGYKAPLGTVDYYPNGGFRFQPGCKSGENSSTEAASGTGYCSHQKSHEYYTRAWSLGGILAVKCASYDIFVTGKCNNSELAFLGREILIPSTGTFYFQIK